MGASRYIAIKAQGPIKPGDFVSGAAFQRLGEPDGFVPADFPEQVAAAQAEIDKASKTKKTAGKKSEL